MQNVDDTITIEVKSRLNDLFGQTADESVEFVNGPRQDASPLKDLKSAVLSLDWEITDDVMSDFIQQVDLLKSEFKNDRVALLFLQLLGSVGKYIQAYKGRSHPQAFKILNTAFNRLEEVVTYPDLKEADKKRYLYAEIIKFKELREKIGLERPLPRTGSGAEVGSKQKSALESSTKDTQAVASGEQRKPAAKTRSVSDSTVSKDTRGEAIDTKAAPVFFEVAEERIGRKNPAAESVTEKKPAGAGRENGDFLGSVFLQNQADAEGGTGKPASIQAPDNILAAIAEIKELIREEFTSLRSQIRSLNRNR